MGDPISSFWRSVKELAKLAKHVKKERRATSLVKQSILKDIYGSYR